MLNLSLKFAASDCRIRRGCEASAPSGVARDKPVCGELLILGKSVIRHTQVEYMAATGFTLVRQTTFARGWVHIKHRGYATATEEAADSRCCLQSDLARQSCAVRSPAA